MLLQNKIFFSDEIFILRSIFEKFAQIVLGFSYKVCVANFFIFLSRNDLRNCVKKQYQYFFEI
jgi:hypothetical protein